MIARLTLLMLLLSGCAPSQQRDEASTPDLASIAMQVKTHLINAEPLAAAAVQVEQQSGKLYLRGFVDSEAKKRELERIAGQAAGSRTVVNELQVK